MQQLNIFCAPSNRPRLISLSLYKIMSFLCALGEHFKIRHAAPMGSCNAFSILITEISMQCEKQTNPIFDKSVGVQFLPSRIINLIITDLEMTIVVNLGVKQTIKVSKSSFALSSLMWITLMMENFGLNLDPVINMLLLIVLCSLTLISCPRVTTWK